MLNLPVEKVNVVWTPGTGSYGKNDAADAAMDAAVLSKAVGRPVRVQGTRQQGHGWDPKGPASVHVSRAAIDRDGRVTAWHVDTKAFSKHDFWNDESRPEYTLAGQLMGFPLDPEFVFSPIEDSYGFQAIRKTFGTIRPLLDRASPLRTAPLRDPGGLQLYFAVESFMDELAFAIGMDPAEFRLIHLTDPRDIVLVKTVAERSQWQKRTAPREQARGDVFLGQGIAYCQRAGSRVAMVADIEVGRNTGKIWAKRFTVAHDCGQIINPDLLRLAIEGNIVQSTSRATVGRGYV
jgi:nicotinate dehydrogenase subunit B